MDAFRFGSLMSDNPWPRPATHTNTQMNPPPNSYPQRTSNPAPPTEPQDMESNWTVDSADVFVRTGPNGMSRFTPWESTATTVPNNYPAPSAIKEHPPRANSNTNNTLFPHPALSLPPPELKFDFRMSLMLTSPSILGSSAASIKTWVSLSGGTWSGSFGSGTVAPGGQSTFTFHNDSYVVEMKTDYLLHTKDEPPAAIAVHMDGVRAGSREVLEQLLDPEKAGLVDPRRYRFRLFIRMETADKRYAEKVNFGLWVGSAVRDGSEIIYDGYRVQ